MNRELLGNSGRKNNEVERNYFIKPLIQQAGYTGWNSFYSPSSENASAR
jgi:hypothetical protein